MNEKLETDLCVHPTGKHQYLLKSSCHSSHTKYSNSFSTEHAHGPSSMENLINTTKADPDEGYFSLTEILGNLIQILAVRSGPEESSGSFNPFNLTWTLLSPCTKQYSGQNKPFLNQNETLTNTVRTNWAVIRVFTWVACVKPGLSIFLEECGLYA